MRSGRDRGREIPLKHRYRVVAIGASAGGIKALQMLLAQLPESFPVPIVVVQHLDPKHPSMIVSIMQRVTKLKVAEARGGDSMKPGNVYFAPPNHHLLVSQQGTFVLVDTELVHFVRPSADLLFESLASFYKEGVLGVVLTGNGIDGAQGARAIKQMGGTVISQNEESAEFPGMPRAAIATGCVDHILPIERISQELIALTGNEA